MFSRIAVIAVLFFIVFSGCVSNPAQGNNPPSSNSNTIAATQQAIAQYVDSAPAPVVGPGDKLITCGTNEECFEDALKSCNRATATFWYTIDNQPLDFESAGYDIESLGAGIEKCKVRLYVSADSTSQFAGQSATCLLERTTNAKGEKDVFDVYGLGPDHCEGTFVDSIRKTAQ